MKRLLSIICALLVLASAKADDWPNWMGPTRDNVWHEDGLLERFPEGGPKILWRTPVAIGYAGPAVSNGKVFINDFVTDQKVKVANFNRRKFKGTERMLCLDAKNGKVLWKHEYDVTTNVSYPSGPRCTPTVDGDKVYSLGAVGNLICFEAATGKIVWEKDLPTEYKTKVALWGYASSPRVHGDMLYCLVGGEGSHIVAFNKDTGKEIWRSQTSPEQGYSPVKIIKAGGVEQMIVMSPVAVTSLNPKTGEKYWSVKYTATNGSIIMKPIVYKEYLFVGGYQKQNLMLKLGQDKPGATVVWQNNPRIGLSPVNIQPFLGEGGIVYGSNADGKIYGVELPSGKRLWETSKPISPRPAGVGTAFIVRQGDRFWLFNEKGELVIAKMTPKGYEEISRAKILKPTNTAFGREVVWSMPAFANKCAYIRNDEEIVCVDLSR